MAKKKLLKKAIAAPLSERHFGVVLENIDSKLDLVVEGQGALDVKIDKVDEKLEDFRKEVNYKFDVVFEKFDEIDTQFSDVKDELHIIRNELKEKIGRDEFILLEKRVAALEKSR